MEQKKSMSKRRFGVVITYLSLISIVSVFEYGTNVQWNIILKVTGIISLIVFIVALSLTLFRTGLWKFTHKPLENLDEREIVLTSKSLRCAYRVFTVAVLIILLSYSLLEKQLNIVLVTSLIVFAHTLPASIIAWTEKQVKQE